MSAPLRSVLDAFAAGARSRADLTTATGLRPDVVDAALDYLVRLGRIEARALATGCPSGGCGSCASGVAGAPGCGTDAPSPQRTGPVLVELRLTR
jgi:hypothetical protein